MLRHIVMWKFRPGTEAERDLFLTGLQGLYGAIPELKSCQVLRGMEGSDYDAVLISEFADRAALETYKNDPRHKAVSALCKSIRTDRAAVDYLLHGALKQAGIDLHIELFCGLLVTVWLIINELISVLENLAAIGVPGFPRLNRLLSRLKNTVNEKEDEHDA